MPVGKNNNCSHVQSKLNKGGLCQSCFHIRINNEQSTKPLSHAQSIIDEDPSDNSNDRYVIDMLKEHMLAEKKRDMELIELLKDNIIYLKNDITHKNM